MKDGCVFCDYQGPSEILKDFDYVYVIEPLHPVTGGHLLFIPKAHVEMKTGLGYVVTAIQRTMGRAMHFVWANELDANIIMSTGPHATQTVQHFHVHVVPRREGDGLKLPWSDQYRTHILNQLPDGTWPE